MMEAHIFNFKEYTKGSMCGFFDLSLDGIVVTGCKAFAKDDRVWFGRPAERIRGRDGKDRWREIVTASAPIMRHLQEQVQPQIRAQLYGNAEDPGAQRKIEGGSPVPRTNGEGLMQYRPAPDGMPY